MVDDGLLFAAVGCLAILSLAYRYFMTK